jgi:hypothetical protein
MKTESSGFSEIVFGIAALVLVWIFSHFGGPGPLLSGIAAVWIAIYFFSSGLHILRGGTARPAQTVVSAAAAHAPVAVSPTLADKMASIHIPKDLKCPSCGASIRPTDRKCNYCGSSLVPLIDLPQPANFGDVQVGQTIRVGHPKQGELVVSVRRRLFYGELWQEHAGPSVPWTTTGTYFVGLGLERDLFLLNWRSRFFLLESRSPLTDMDINRDFAPYARQFAASNQTADVRFRYKDSTWHIDDIGKFRIEYFEGDGAEVSTGSTGRFIHASAGPEALVVEDYQSGGSGGLDTLWRGFLIQSADVNI